jgi:hypothetical protein
MISDPDRQAVAYWSVHTLDELLAKLGLASYAPRFAEQEVCHYPNHPFFVPLSLRSKT